MSKPMEQRPLLICVGMITAPHGVGGAVRLKSFTQDPESIFDYDPLYNKTGNQSFHIESFSGQVRHQFIVKISHINTREKAEELRGLKIYVPRDCLPPTHDQDEFYLADLMGLRVYNLHHKPIGMVEHIRNFGAGDMIDIRISKESSFLLPFTKTMVPIVDMENRCIFIDPPEGLIPEDKHHLSCEKE